MSCYQYQDGDVVRVTEDAYYRAGGGRREFTVAELRHRVGKEFVVRYTDSDGDLVAYEPEFTILGQPDGVKPVEIQGIRVGDTVEWSEADSFEGQSGTAVVSRFNLDNSMGGIPHPFILEHPETAGAERPWSAAKARKVPVAPAPIAREEHLIMPDYSKVHVTQDQLNDFMGNVWGDITAEDRRRHWSEVQENDVVTATWRGQKNKQDAVVTVTSMVAPDRLVGGLGWYGQLVTALKNQQSGWTIDKIARPLTVRERRLPQEVTIIRPQSTGGRWDDYNLVTSGTAYVEGTRSGDAYDGLTAVFNDGKGHVILKEGDRVYVNGEVVAHHQLFAATHVAE